MLSAKTADLAPVVPVIALVELNDSNQPKAGFQTPTSALQRFRSFALGGCRMRGLGPNPVIELLLIGPQRLEFWSFGYS